MPKLTVPSPYVNSGVDSHMYHWHPYARVDCIPQSGTLDLASGVTIDHGDAGMKHKLMSLHPF